MEFSLFYFKKVIFVTFKNRVLWKNVQFFDKKMNFAFIHILRENMKK